jgi:hypothetical protein
VRSPEKCARDLWRNPLSASGSLQYGNIPKYPQITIGVHQWLKTYVFFVLFCGKSVSCGSCLSRLMLSKAKSVISVY